MEARIIRIIKYTIWFCIGYIAATVLLLTMY